MDILVDTHLLLWALTDNPKLPAGARNYITNEGNVIYYSIASVWEVAIKHIKKPKQMLLNDEEFVKGCRMAGYRNLSLTEQQIALLKTLRQQQGENMVQHHNPFDRILLAQAKGMRFMTHDFLILYYNENFVISV